MYANLSFLRSGSSYLSLIITYDLHRLKKTKRGALTLQIDAYPYTVWGLLPGRVIRISADYVQESEKSGAFKVIVTPDRDYLRTHERLTGSLKKGMTGNARFFIARRSLWELVYESMDNLFNPATKNDSLAPIPPQ